MTRIKALLARVGSAGLVPLALTLGLTALALVAALAGFDVVALVLLAISILGEFLLARNAPELNKLLDQAALSSPARFLLRGAVALVATERVDSDTATHVLLGVVVGLMLVLCLRELHREYRRVGPLRPMRTRNIPGDTRIDVAPPPRPVSVVLTQVAALLPAPLGAPWPVALVVGALAIAWLALQSVPDALVSWRMRQSKRATGYTPQLRAVQDFLDDYRPEVLLHLSGPPGSAYQINTWLDTLESLDRRVMILLRDDVLFDTMRKTDLPVLELANAGEFLQLDFSSAFASLFPSNTGNNIHLLRLPSMMSAFIGHGDSDKSASNNPFSRVYDELWVAGEAGADRYRRSGLGIHESQYRFVGRPQVDGIQRTPVLGEQTVPTVLYAPTWEGVNSDQEYSSVSALGEKIVTALLAGGVRVIYKPHPFTGQRDAKYRAVDARIAALVNNAKTPGGPDHKVVRGGAIDRWFNEASALVTDISSVVSDFLASEKPYAVFNHTTLDEASFRTEFPSTGASTVLGRDGSGLDEFVAVVTERQPDERRAARAELATYLLGPTEQRTHEAFAASVETFIARCAAERTQYRG